ncbi:hypothetical protein MNBD_GAMMA12-636 [hydrothermal vent metagenome]|uniref:Protein hipA n=1 Tax=hydrothermal vent metagenome TaxID=652676 RepID=A0A3B0YGM4_9ZZZZ
MNDSIVVVCNSKTIGHLWLDEQAHFTFQYDEDWLNDPDATPLSLLHPLQTDPIKNDKTRVFFTHLLPEQELKKIVARNLEIPVSDDFSLLGAIAGDCMGDITLVPSESILFVEDKERKTQKYRLLSENDLASSPQGWQPLFAGEEGVRLSVSGTVEKLPVYVDDQGIYLPVEGSVSSHVIKSDIPGHENSVLNELFCTELAAKVGLPVLEGVLHDDLYLVSRSDRQRTKDGRVTRIHQEDFCQLLDISPEITSEKEGGASLKQCFELVRRYSANPAIDMNLLLKWVLFSYLIGHQEATAKNLSFVWTAEGPRLAPFSDIISDAVYCGAGQPLAMCIGSEDRPSWIVTRRWENFAKEVNIKSKYVILTLDEMARQIVGLAECLVIEHFSKVSSDRIVASIQQIIRTRSRNVLHNLKASSAH